jgi:hypothetical protein
VDAPEKIEGLQFGGKGTDSVPNQDLFGGSMGLLSLRAAASSFQNTYMNLEPIMMIDTSCESYIYTVGTPQSQSSSMFQAILAPAAAPVMTDQSFFVIYRQWNIPSPAQINTVPVVTNAISTNLNLFWAGVHTQQPLNCVSAQFCPNYMHANPSFVATTSTQYTAMLASATKCWPMPIPLPALNHFDSRSIKLSTGQTEIMPQQNTHQVQDFNLYITNLSNREAYSWDMMNDAFMGWNVENQTYPSTYNPRYVRSQEIIPYWPVMYPANTALYSSIVNLTVEDIMTTGQNYGAAGQNALISTGINAIGWQLTAAQFQTLGLIMSNPLTTGNFMAAQLGIQNELNPLSVFAKPIISPLGTAFQPPQFRPHGLPCGNFASMDNQSVNPGIAPISAIPGFLQPIAGIGETMATANFGGWTFSGNNCIMQDVCFKDIQEMWSNRLAAKFIKNGRTCDFRSQWGVEDQQRTIVQFIPISAMHPILCPYIPPQQQVTWTYIRTNSAQPNFLLTNIMSPIIGGHWFMGAQWTTANSQAVGAQGGTFAGMLTQMTNDQNALLNWQNAFLSISLILSNVQIYYRTITADIPLAESLVAQMVSVGMPCNYFEHETRYFTISAGQSTLQLNLITAGTEIPHRMIFYATIPAYMNCPAVMPGQPLNMANWKNVLVTWAYWNNITNTYVCTPSLIWSNQTIVTGTGTNTTVSQYGPDNAYSGFQNYQQIIQHYMFIKRYAYGNRGMPCSENFIDVNGFGHLVMNLGPAGQNTFYSISAPVIGQVYVTLTLNSPTNTTQTIVNTVQYPRMSQWSLGGIQIDQAIIPGTMIN